LQAAPAASVRPVRANFLDQNREGSIASVRRSKLAQVAADGGQWGSTILRRQVADFGASLRELPPGVHKSLDTFYRKLILLAFHPGGAKRVLSEKQAVAEAAISREEFCRRYQGHRSSLAA
jgi:hypothetical protein